MVSMLVLVGQAGNTSLPFHRQPLWPRMLSALGFSSVLAPLMFPDTLRAWGCRAAAGRSPLPVLLPSPVPTLQQQQIDLSVPKQAASEGCFPAHLVR